MSVEFRQTVRGLLRAPVLSLASIACVALGVAATTAVVTFLNAALLQQLPFPAADRLVRVWLVNRATDDPRTMLSIPELRDLEAHMRSFDALLGTARSRLVAIFETGAERMRGEGVTRDYFGALGLRPQAGRLLDAGDFAADARPVMVISSATWQRRFGGQASAVGRTLRTETRSFTIVGVAPAGFAGTVEEDVVEFWMPLPQFLPASYVERRDGRAAWAIGRLREGLTPQAAEAELQTLFASLAASHPDVYKDLSARLEPMGDNWRAPFRRSAVLLSVAAALLLVVGAFNVAGLLVARTIDRRREFAVRTALGASRRHLVLPLVLEAAVLIGAGGALGVWTAPRLLESLLELAPVRLPQYVSVGTSMTPLIASIAVIGVAGLLAALVPALLATRMNAADALKQAGRGSWAGAGQRRWPNVLIAVETALTLMLLVGGALLLRSHATLTGTEPGHRVEGMVRLALTASAADVQETADLPAFYERLRADLLTHPGVRQVGLVAPTLPPWDGYQGAIRHPRLPDLPGAQGHAVSLHLADAALLPSLGIPIVAGRNIDPQDISGRRPVAVVSLGLATRLGGIDAALDEEIAIVGDATVPPVRARVVGVAADVAYDGLGQRGAGRFVRYSDGWDPKAGRQDVYLPLAQFAQRQFSIAVHTGQDEEVALEELRRRLGRSAPTSAVHWNTTMRGELALDYTSSRFYAVLVNAFSLSALLLTAVSLFAILSHAVARRTGEIGLRRALGGSGAQIARFVAGLGLAPLAVGLLAGLTGSMAVARSAASMLYGVAMLDFTAFAGGALVLLIVAVLAASLPSHRASRIDPLVALKTE